MIDIKLFDADVEHGILEAVVSFNTFFKNDPPGTMDMGYYELWKKDKSVQLHVWRNFYTDDRVQEFYEREFELGLRAKRNVLLRKVGENNSTATVQGLMSLLKREEDTEVDVDEGKIFIYSFIPLNQHEMHAGNVRILDNIPQAIDDALIIVDGDNEETE